MTVYSSGVRLKAFDAAQFYRDLSRATDAVSQFQKVTAKGADFNTRGISSAFNAIAHDAGRAGQSAAEAFGRGMSGLDTVVTGALLSVGARVVDVAVDAFAAAGRQASQAFSSAMEFEQAIANISALADGQASASGAIAAAVQGIAVSPELIGSVKSAGVAFEQLERQGVATADSLNGVLEATVLFQNAAGESAGNIHEMAVSAEVVGQAMRIFRTEASQAGDVTDTLASVVLNTQHNINDLTYLLSNTSSAVQSLGLNLDDLAALTIATAGSFSSARTQGTGLETLLARLAAPSKEAQAALDELGVTAYTVDGAFVGLESLQKQLQVALGDTGRTMEETQRLLVNGFGATASQMAVALAKGQQFADAMRTVESTSASAIASIKVDTAATRLANLGDIADDMRRRLAQPFNDELAPAIVAVSELLSSLTAQFDSAGARISDFLGPMVAGFTEQINQLTARVSGGGGSTGSFFDPSELFGNIDTTGLLSSLTKQFENIAVAATPATTALTTIFNNLSNLSTLPDLSTLTAGVGEFVRAWYDVGTTLVASVDSKAIGEGAALLAGKVTAALAGAIAAAKPLEIAESFTGYWSQVTITATDAIKTAMAELAQTEFAIDGKAIGEGVTTLAATLVNQLAATLSRPELGENIGSAFGDLLAGMVNQMTGLLSGADKGLEELDASAVGASIDTFLKGFIDNLTAQLDGADTTGLSTAVRDLIFTALSKLGDIQIDVGGLAGRLSDVFFTTIEDALVGGLEGLPGSGALASFVADRQAERDRLIAEADQIYAAANEARDRAAEAGASWIQQNNAFLAEQARLQQEFAQKRNDAALSAVKLPTEASLGFTPIAEGGIFGAIGKLINADLVASFAPDVLYTPDIRQQFTDTGMGIKTDLATAFAKDALYPPELAFNFASIAQSISGAFTSIYDAIAGFLSSIPNILPSWLGGGGSSGKTATATDTGPGLAESGRFAINVEAQLSPKAYDSYLEYKKSIEENPPNLLPKLGPLPGDPANAVGSTGFFDGTALAETIQATSDAEIAAMEEQTKLLKPPPATTSGFPTSFEDALGVPLTNVATATQIATTAQTAAASAAQATATVHGDIAESLQSSGGDLHDLFNDLTGVSEQMSDAFNVLRSEVAGAAADFDGLDAKLTAYVEVLEGAPGSLTDAFAGLIGAIENAMEKIDGAVDGDNPPPPTNTGNTPQPFAKGTRYYPGGLGLAGEDDPELYITPGGKAGMLGLRGPELFTAPPGTQIYPADITRQILGRGARPIGGDGIFSAAMGAFRGIPYLDSGNGGGAALPVLAPSKPASSVLLDNLPSLPPITIPREDDNSSNRTVSDTGNKVGSVTTSMLAAFLQSLEQQKLSDTGVNPTQLAQQVIGAVSNNSTTTAERMAELFTKPLTGGRYSAPQTQIINIAIKDSHDTVTNNTVHQYGGLQVKSMQSTGNLQRDFRLLQAMNG